jgi:two-component system sensor histidine kinase/response regulator
MPNSAQASSERARYRIYFWLLVVAWTGSVVGSLVWSRSQNDIHTHDLAIQTARALVEKDILYREWASLKGGVYVVVTPDTPPNPYLEVPERDIATPSGKQLTLLNPAYMTRQVFELQVGRTMGIQGHLTSLKPIRPANAADPWERVSLEAFERKVSETTTLDTVNGRQVLRLMRPMVTLASCLKCHAKQGYKVGDIRGGVSVTVPMAIFPTPAAFGTLALAHAGLWTLGIVGLAFGWRSVRRNTIARERAYEALTVAKDLAEKANRVKSEFLANMSHEIRTPMNGIVGMTGLLLDSNLTAEQRQFAGVVRTSADALLDIINDILDFSKIEAGGIELERIPFDLYSTVEDIMELLAVKAGEKTLEFACTIHPDVPVTVVGDPTRIRQVLTNLVGNAIKFTSAGEVVVRVTREHESPSAVTVRISVTDTGPGIAPEGMDRLFKSFSQVDASTTRKFGGTGLGLAICRRLTELMGGRIGVESEVGKGSTFWFTVVLETRQPEASRGLADSDVLRQCRVIVIDDNATNRLLLQEQLKGWGASCETVSRGADALRMLREASELGSPFQVAIIDREMPEMDGMTLGREIRSAPALAGIRLILLTSSGRSGDEALAREIGFVAYLRKPARQSHLLGCLLAAARGAASPLEDAPAVVTDRDQAPKGSLHGVRVLLAEDNRVNQLVAMHILAKLGARADAVADGQEALDALRAAPYDVVLMDVEMPVMDGLETTAAIRRMESDGGKRLPIIAMTAHAMKGDRERFLGAGMDGYVAKPFTRSEVVAAIDTALGRT